VASRSPEVPFFSPPAIAMGVFFLTHSFFDQACLSWSKLTLCMDVRIPAMPQRASPALHVERVVHGVSLVLKGRLNALPCFRKWSICLKYRALCALATN